MGFGNKTAIECSRIKVDFPMECLIFIKKKKGKKKNYRENEVEFN